MPTPTLLAASGLAFATLPLLLGTNALLRPTSGLSTFQLPPPKDPYGSKLALGLTRVYGARNATLGLSVPAMWRYERFGVLGWTCLAGCVMTVTDGFVARDVAGGGKEWWTHWCFAPVGLALGGGVS